MYSYREFQDIGLAWGIKYSSGTKIMKLYFPLCLFVVDMKGARQLCGMYDTSSHLMKQPCVSCDIPSNMLEKIYANQYWKKT